MDSSQLPVHPPPVTAHTPLQPHLPPPILPLPTAAQMPELQRTQSQQVEPPTPAPLEPAPVDVVSNGTPLALAAAVPVSEERTQEEPQLTHVQHVSDVFAPAPVAPAALPAPVSAPVMVLVPEPVAVASEEVLPKVEEQADVVMEETKAVSPPSLLKRSAPEDTLVGEVAQVVGNGSAVVSNGEVVPPSAAFEGQGEAKRQKVEETPAEVIPSPYVASLPTPPAAEHTAPLAHAPTPVYEPTVVAAPVPALVAAPVAAPAPMVPSCGYDPSAFYSQSPAPIAALPTVSPAELLIPAASAALPLPSTSAAVAYGEALPAAPLNGLPLASTSASLDPLAPAPLEGAVDSFAPVVPAPEGPIAVLTKEQQKFALSLLRTLKKHRSAPPFLRPVDPIALLIPDYFRVVTMPMDLGTVENKLTFTGKAMAASQKAGRIYGIDYIGAGQWEGKREAGQAQYRTAEEFREDIERVWENCFKYNGPKEKNPVSAMAGQLQEVYEKMWRNMPSAPAVLYTPEPPRAASPDHIKKERRPSSAVNNPTIRRSEEGSRPKREIVAPARELAYYGEASDGRSRGGRVSGKMAQEQLRFCREVIKELFKKVHESYAYVFYEPVNYIALNIPQYPTLIKHPMDLGTIRTKLEQNKYPVPPYEAFEHDVRLIFKNCYVFNPPGTPVNDWGRRVEDVFERKWEERPLGDDDDYSEDDTITAMERQLHAMQSEIASMKAAKHAAKVASRPPPPPPRAPRPPKKPEVRNRNPTSSSNKKRKSSGSSNKRKSGGRRNEWSEDDEEEYEEEEEETVTFEMKRELAVKIVSFEGDDLEKAIDIIRRGRPELLGDANKEIELDIDQLDQRTLLSLYRFVCPPVRRSHAAAPKSNRANPNKGGGTGGTKRKNLDEMKESQRIEMLEARLRDFENGAAGGGGAVATPVAAAGGEDQASSASSEEGSESESESDED